MNDRAALEQVARVEALLEEVESLPETARGKALDAARALLDLHGAVLERIVEHVAEHDERGEIASAVADDDLVSHVLLVHGLHPVPLEARVRGALEDVRPYLESHGGNVELLGVESGKVRLRLEGSCSGCPSSAVTLKLAIEDAIHKAAPDVDEIESEGEAQSPSPQLIQLEVHDAPPGPAGSPAAGNGHGRAPEASEGAWAMAGGLPELRGASTGPLLKEVAGERLIFLRVGESLYAYRSRCPGCGESLEEAAVEGTELTCRGCGKRFDVIRAGRCLDSPQLHLEPVPLLADDAGLVKVALGAAT